MATTTAAARRAAFTPTPGSGEYPRLLGGRLCLDFVNTLEDLRSAAPQEFLLDARDLAGCRTAVILWVLAEGNWPPVFGKFVELYWFIP